MKKLERNMYDVIIVGAGIGGLVCGAYLAKRGMSVLLLEKKGIPGGYCSYFTRNNIKFDMGLHMLTGCKAGGPLGVVLDELGLRDVLSLRRPNVYEVIYNRNKKISIFNDLSQTKDSFFKNFSRNDRKKIDNFINFVVTFKITSRTMLNRFLCNSFTGIYKQFGLSLEVRNIFDILLNTFTLPTPQLNAITGVTALREYLTDGGYYPKHGLGELAMILSGVISKHGGEIRYLSEVEKVNEFGAKKVVVHSGIQSYATDVVFNCDPFQVTSRLLGSKMFSESALNFYNKRYVSLSAFLTFVILKSQVNIDSSLGIWYFPIKDVTKYMIGVHRHSRYANKCFFCMPNVSTSKALTLMSTVPYIGEQYWLTGKGQFERSMLTRAEALFGKAFSRKIDSYFSVSPVDLERLTSNFHGSIRGWAFPRAQAAKKSLLDKIFKSPNLYFAGHWATANSPMLDGGVSMAARSGSYVAKRILLARNTI